MGGLEKTEQGCCLQGNLSQLVSSNWLTGLVRRLGRPTGHWRKALWSQASCVLSVFRRRTMPGMEGVWRWQNWAEEACCSLLDSRMVSTTCSLSSEAVCSTWGVSQHGLP